MLDTARDDLWVVRWTTDEHGAAALDETWSELTGQSREEASNCGWLRALHPDDAAAMIETLGASLARRTAFRHEVRVRLRDGAYRWTLGVGAPRFDGARLLGYAGAIVDIHESRAARLALRDNEEKLRLALAAAEMGTFSWDLETNRCARDARMLALFGLPHDGALSLNSAIERDIVPDDRQRFADALRRACDPAGDGLLREDVRVLWPDGSSRWLQIWAQTRFSDEPRRPLRLVGSGIDVTAREEARAAIRVNEERLAVAHERLSAALRASPVVAFELDRDLRYVWIQNPLHGIRAEDVIGRTVAELLEREEDARAIAAIKQRVLDTGVAARQDVAMQFKGVAGWYDLIVEPRWSGGEIVGLLCTATDITDHRRTEDALKEADRRKDRFLAVLGHELRNPLASLQNAVQAMQADGFADPGAAAFAIMARQVGHLGRLVDDLLDVSRISQDKIALRREPVDVGLALSEALAASRPEAEARGVRLALLLPPEPQVVIGDATRIAQIVANLVANAVKYAGPGGLVRAGASRDGGSVVVTVADDGVGIEPELLPRVFDLFMQADPAPSGGLGIGLALAKKLTELHGGVIEAESAPGAGSVFTVRLPLGAAAPDAVAGAAAQPAMPPGVKVLVIDDNHDVADSFAMLLDSLGVPVRVAYDGEAGVEAAASFAPDIAFIDIRMPGIDGYETARRIGRLACERRPTLVALSGLGRDSDRERSRAAGLRLHLIKPVRIDDIRRVIAMRAGAG